MSELKSCPFCGGEVEATPGGDYYEIRCDDCRLVMWADTYEQLRMAWNGECVKMTNEQAVCVIHNYVQKSMFHMSLELMEAMEFAEIALEEKIEREKK